MHSSNLKRLALPSQDVLILSSSWNVKSQNKINVEYTISKSHETCPENCQFICKYCKICVHIYSCTCLDNFIKGNMCKHIHHIINFDQAKFTTESSSAIEQNNEENVTNLKK